MIIKYFLILIFFPAFISYSFADRKADISSYFNSKNYSGAVDYLKNNFGSNSEITLSIFSGLLAFSYNRLNYKNEEYKWISEYFENYPGDENKFSFLGENPFKEIRSYLSSWKNKYPLITEVSLIEEKSSNESALPSQLKIGVNISNEAFYNFSDKNNTIQAGLFRKGLNLLGLKLSPLLENSSLHSYFLDLKADDLILKKEIGINIELESGMGRGKIENGNPTNEFIVSMQVGDKLFVTGKGNLEKFFSIDVKKLLEPHLSKYSKEIKEMYNPLPSKYRSGSQNQSNISTEIFRVDLIDVYNALKQYRNKEKSEKISKELKKISQIEITFKNNTEKGEKEVRAVIYVKVKHLGSLSSR